MWAPILGMKTLLQSAAASLTGQCPEAWPLKKPQNCTQPSLRVCAFFATQAAGFSLMMLAKTSTDQMTTQKNNSSSTGKWKWGTQDWLPHLTICISWRIPPSPPKYHLRLQVAARSAPLRWLSVTQHTTGHPAQDCIPCSSSLIRQPGFLATWTVPTLSLLSPFSKGLI
jgi:hypothetical protein